MCLTVWLAAGLFTTAQAQTEGTGITEGLKKVYETHCNGVTFALWYSPQSDVTHLRDESPSDYARDRLTMLVSNALQPADRQFSFTEPKPLASFARLYKKVGERWKDITVEALDPRHSGSASKKNMRFKRIGDTYASTTVYPAFTTITNPQDIEQGDYLLRFRMHTYLEVEDQPCPLSLPDLPINVR